MTLETCAFKPAHINAMRVQSTQTSELGCDDAMTAAYGQAWTIAKDGVPLACCGLVEVWAGRAYAWALLSEDAGPHMIGITRAIRCGLDRSTFRRIEMAVADGFDAGKRWAELLGFRLETPAPMRAYLPNGKDAWLYARTKWH